MNNAQIWQAAADKKHREIFKRSYYEIGDKIIALSALQGCKGSNELNAIIADLTAQYNALRQWADLNLPNWD